MERNRDISGNWEKCVGYRSMGASGLTPDYVSRNQGALIYQGLGKEKRLAKANPYPDLECNFNPADTRATFPDH